VGWGVEGVSFHHEDKPKLRPFVQQAVDLDLNTPPTPPLNLEDLPTPTPRISDELLAELIPFGGGSNISGSLEAPPDETRTVVSIDLGRLNPVLEIDNDSGLATIQAGTLGPDV